MHPAGKRFTDSCDDSLNFVRRNFAFVIRNRFFHHQIEDGLIERNELLLDALQVCLCAVVIASIGDDPCLSSKDLVFPVVMLHFKDTGTKACLRERILGRAYFNEGVCDVNHNSLQFSTRILVCMIMRPAVTVPHIDWF